MIFYKEEKKGLQSIFTKVVTNESGNILHEKTVSLPLYKVDFNGLDYFILYDENMIPNKKFYQFLNFKLIDTSINSRNKAAFTLKLFYSFLSLTGYTEDNLGEVALRELILFIKGVNSNPESYSIITNRSNKTVNNYLSTIRSYFLFSNIYCDSLFRTQDSYNSNSSNFIELKNDTKFLNNLKNSDYSSDTVPKYISPIEFRKLYKIFIENNDTQAKIITHLMYGYGMRLGEVLGITLEDITEITHDGKQIPAILLRNRISDSRFQFAKGLPHIINSKQYFSRDYISSTVKIIITYSLYEDLINYIEENHSYYIDKYPNNYHSGIADIVSKQSNLEENHYVFLNRYGKILNDQTWNNKLKKYFKLANIPVDSNYKENNLSHRFRHGFAMFHARFSNRPADTLSLQKMMRHKSISSTLVYYNPTPDDEYKIKTEFQNDLYEMIPELRKGFEHEYE